MALFTTVQCQASACITASHNHRIKQVGRMSLGSMMLLCGSLALPLLLFPYTLPKLMWALVILPHMHAAIAQGWAGLLFPFSIQVHAGERRLLNQFVMLIPDLRAVC